MIESMQEKLTRHARPFVEPIKTPELTRCILYFHDLGTRAGTAEESSALIGIILAQLRRYDSKRPQGRKASFNERRAGVRLRFTLTNTPLRDLEVAKGALNLQYAYVQLHGARDYESFISCHGDFVGSFKVDFENGSLMSRSGGRSSFVKP